jgi:transcriptional regulator with XRE-family HTH domain
MYKIGERLKQLREKAGLKQKEMAEFLEIGKPGYNRIETGKVDITLKHLLKIAGKFEVSLDWLILGRKDEPYLTDYVEFAGTVKEMLNDMNNDPVFLHGMLSHYHQMREKRAKSNDNGNDKDKELGNDNR